MSVLLLLGCDAQVAERFPKPKLVLLYATCSLNRNHLWPYDSTRPYTPNLRRFAEDAAVLKRHQTESGQSGVSFASIFSGLQAPGHGIYFHPQELDDRHVLIGEHFRDAGYETYSWLAHVMANARLAYAQGVPKERQSGTMLLADSPAFANLLERLGADPELRAFVVTNFTLTHSPYKGAALADFCKRYRDRCGVRDHPKFGELRKLYRANHIDLSWDFENTVDRLGLSPEDQAVLENVVSLLYEADVAGLDRRFGGVVEAIENHGLLSERLIVFTADHGEIGVRDGAAFRWIHGMQLAPEVLDVPMIVRAPKSGVRSGPYEKVTRSIDVLPTLLGLAGLPPAEDVEGVDLSAGLRDSSKAPELVGWSHTAMLPRLFRRRQLPRYPTLLARFPDTNPDKLWVAARRGDAWFQLRSGPGGLSAHYYAVDRDPGKADNLFDDSDADHQAMLESMRQYRSRLIDEYSDGKTRVVPEAAAEERLRALGYVE